MRLEIHLVTAAILVAGSLAAPASAQPASLDPDRPFVAEAAAGNLAEVELGRLAAQRAAADAVRQFGARMVRDHSQAQSQLTQLAAAKGVSLPAELDAERRTTYERLAALAGPRFDEAYMGEMVADHTKDVAAFEGAAQTAPDADVRAWAAQTLPVLREHLRLAEQLHARTAAVPAAPAALAARPPAVAVGAGTAAWCGGAYLPSAGTNFGGCAR
ncbi:MAG TPA: DUF4142 domain-containing protein [Methylomirabilota bacterium]|nr:DUF4142 domain-containing protein [Methylomirabilota bacterium]